ncbi:MAG: NADH-quinone oxidoreductase subunit NuoN [Proteobacteria bacterium]|nr:NADH-quinone oxidoreductase subunit NuoN [Pseudomonadota bacterium]
MPFDWFAVAPALPEVFLACAAMGLLIVGVFSRGEVASRSVGGLALVSLVVTYVIMHAAKVADFQQAFPKGAVGFMFVADEFAFYAKGLILAAGVFSILLTPDFMNRNSINKFEYYVLITLATLGMMIMVSANDLLAMYVGMELMSFCLYILAAFWRDNLKSSEAGLKYFVLGSLASGLMLYGMSLLYGMTGDTSFDGIGILLGNGLPNIEHSVAITVALVLMIVAMAFKVSAVPFHMWTPDVYEGAPTPVTVFMATAPKAAAMLLMMRVLYQPLLALEDQWMQMLTVLSLLTMGIGSLLAIVQTNIKRLLAYSSIGNVGFMLVGVVAGTEDGVQGVLVYLAIYLTMTIGLFAVLLSLRRKNVFVETIDDLAGLARTAPGAAFAMMLITFSLAGVPPLVGFFGKFYVFSAAIAAGQTWLAISGVLFSVIAAYYCLRIVKVMYFDEGKFRPELNQPSNAQWIAVLAAAGVLVMSVFIDVLDHTAGRAASSLFRLEHTVARH